MENAQIKEAWELAENDIDYQNYQENMMLLEDIVTGKQIGRAHV